MCVVKKVSLRARGPSRPRPRSGPLKQRDMERQDRCPRRGAALRPRRNEVMLWGSLGSGGGETWCRREAVESEQAGCWRLLGSG